MGNKTAEARERGANLMEAQRRAGINTFTPQNQIEVTVQIYNDYGEPVVGIVDGEVFVGSQNILIAWARMMMIAAGIIIKERVFHRKNIKWADPQIIE